jgi:membrane associated rhomboid family serine protease/Flp pilus assembly protein TadD
MAKCVQCGREVAGFGFGKPVCKWCRMHAAAQRGESPEDARQPLMPAPWVRRSENAHLVTKSIFGINAAVFLGMALAGVSIMEPNGLQLVAWGANWGPDTFSGDWWRLITATFVHAGIIHLGLNMYCLWYLGSMAESLYGSWTFAAMYLIAGAAGWLASVLWHFEVPAVGASGAIFGIGGALVASLKLGEFSMPNSSTKAVLSSLLPFLGYNLVFGAMWPGIDNAAHLGGLIAGLILGALIAKAAPESRQVFRRLAILLIVLLPVAGGAALIYRSIGYVAHYSRAVQYARENKLDQAASHYRAAARLRRDYFPLHLQLAFAYYDLKEYPEAQSEFQKVIALEPKNGAAHLGLGEIYAIQQNCAAAINEYKTATTLAPELQGANYGLGSCYAKTKRYDDAISAFQRELQVSGDDRRTLVELADAYEAKGMKKEADDARRRAAQLQLQNNDQ